LCDNIIDWDQMREACAAGENPDDYDVISFP
jgi:hypothetical protein